MLFKRKANALTLVLLILASVLTGTLLTQNGARPLIAQGQTTNSTTVVDGNPDSTISIQSPENKTYNVNNVTLHFTIATDFPSAPENVVQPFYADGANLDYNTAGLVNTFQGENWLTFPTSLPLSLTSNGFTANLTGLSQGPHQLTVWLVVSQYEISYDNYVGSVYSTVSFNIDSIPPNITILSPEAKTYNSSVVPMNFTVNKTTSQISYSLDGQQNITTTGNMTLTGLSNGLHNVTVYATDEAGNVGASQTINFTIAIPKAESFSNLPVAASIAAAVVIAVACAGVIVYLRKRKH
jgi:hypothetical protein